MGKGRADVLSAGTVTTTYRYVATIYKAAVADRLIAVSPCTGIKLPKSERQQVKPLAVEEVEALALAIPDRYRPHVVLAAGTGLRQGEAFGLTVEHVDFLRRTLHVRQQLVLLPRHPPYLTAPKTAASVRTVPLPAVVTDALAAHLAAFPPGSEGVPGRGNEPSDRDDCHHLHAPTNDGRRARLAAGTRRRGLRVRWDS